MRVERPWGNHWFSCRLLPLQNGPTEGVCGSSKNAAVKFLARTTCSHVFLYPCFYLGTQHQGREVTLSRSLSLRSSNTCFSVFRVTNLCICETGLTTLIHSPNSAMEETGYSHRTSVEAVRKETAHLGIIVCSLVQV